MVYSPELMHYIDTMAAASCQNNGIKPEMYTEHQVFRGLRDLNGKGVVTGLTEVSNIKAKTITPDGTAIPCHGELSYRGINVRDLVAGFTAEKRYGFEEVVYLLLFSKLPTAAQLAEFKTALGEMRSLPPSFVRDMILKASGKDIMNMLSRSVLALYSYDEDPDNIAIPNVLRQCMFLTSVFPLLSVYSYHSRQHYHCGESLIIHQPDKSASIAETILGLLREDGQYTDLEAKMLDLALVLHAEHGGGNNSTFTTHVVTSSGTDTYAAISAALGSLKGPRHGGANIKVVQMFDDMKRTIDVNDEGAIKDYLVRLLNKDAFDKNGLIYGMGHAIYSLSDPRADILGAYAKNLAEAKGLQQEFALYETVARLAPDIIAEKRKMYKGVSANVDFYSGLIYTMLGLPYELFTPIFAVARIAGWSAHRIEEIQNAGKIIRPAYINVKETERYIPLQNRT